MDCEAIPDPAACDATGACMYSMAEMECVLKAEYEAESELMCNVTTINYHTKTKFEIDHRKLDMIT